MHSVIWCALNSCLVATNDGDLAAELRLTRNFGFADIDRVDALGTNAKMSEAHAAIGLANLNIIEATIDASRQCHDRYFNGLAGIPGLRLSRPDVGEVPNWHYVVAALDVDTFGLSRDILVAVFWFDVAAYVPRASAMRCSGGRRLPSRSIMRLQPR